MRGYARIHQLELPFRRTFSHALARRDASGTLVLELRGEHQRGFGEAAPRDYVTGETTAAVLEALRASAPSWASVPIAELATLDTRLDALADWPNARCAVELALLDLLARERDVPVIQVLEPIGRPLRDAIRYSAVLSAEPLEEVRRALGLAKAFGFARIKLKLGRERERDAAVLALARSVMGPEVELYADANGAWSFAEALARRELLREHTVAWIEQPLAVIDDARLAELREHYGGAPKLFVDESVTTPASAEALLRADAVDGFQLKVAKHGGILATLALARRIAEAGRECVLGCHVGESSLLTAAGQIVAALAPGFVAHEGAYAPLLLEHDLVHQSLGFGLGGHASLATVLERPGLGVTLDDALLERSRVALHSL